MKKIILTIMLVLFTTNIFANEYNARKLKSENPSEFKCIAQNIISTYGNDETVILFFLLEESKAYYEVKSGISKGYWKTSDVARQKSIYGCNYITILFFLEENNKAGSKLNKLLN